MVPQKTHRKHAIGLVGAGMWGKTHLKMFQAEPRSAVTWVCDTDPDVRQSVHSAFHVPQVTGDLGEMLADPSLEAVVIASPPYTHAEIALEVLKAGKHLVIEKPMVIQPVDLDRVLEAVASHPELVVLEGSCRHARLNPKYRFIKQIIQSGKLGRIYHIHHNHLYANTFIEYNPHARWSMDKKLAGGGPFIDWGEYDLSFHLGLLDDEPVLQSLRSFTIAGLRDLSKLAPVADVEAHGAALMEFDGGLTYYFERGGGVHGETRNETRLYGTKGGLHFHYTTWEPNTIEYFYDDGKPTHETLTVDMSEHPAHDNEAFVAHFLDCLEGAARPLMPVTLAGKHLRILWQILGTGGPSL